MTKQILYGGKSETYYKGYRYPYYGVFEGVNSNVTFSFNAISIIRLHLWALKNRLYKTFNVYHRLSITRTIFLSTYFIFISFINYEK